jgi:hypothetical protein
MKANPDKYQTISREQNIPTYFSIHGANIIPDECVKLLGIRIDERLTFGNQAALLYARKRANR